MSKVFQFVLAFNTTTTSVHLKGFSIQYIIVDLLAFKSELKLWNLLNFAEKLVTFYFFISTSWKFNIAEERLSPDLSRKVTFTTYFDN